MIRCEEELPLVGSDFVLEVALALHSRERECEAVHASEEVGVIGDLLPEVLDVFLHSVFVVAAARGQFVAI